jgi:trk system potassium uptake protein
MAKQVVVIGLGSFGESVAVTLNTMGYDIMAIDNDQEKVDNLAVQIPHVIQADATNEAILKELEIQNFDVAIVAMGTDIEGSVLSTILLKQLGVKRVIARANNKLHGNILEKIGASYVVYPEQEMGINVAHRLSLTDISDYMLVVGRYGIGKFEIPVRFTGDQLFELGFGPRGKSEVAVLLILRSNEVIVSPSPEERIESGDVLILAGNDNNIEKLLNELKNRKKENPRTTDKNSAKAE